MKIIDMPEFKNRNSILSCSPNKTIYAAVKDMNQKKCGSILVINKGKLCGIFTERDLLTRVISNDYDTKKTKVSEVMTSAPETAKAEDAVTECLGRMSQGRFRHMPIVDDKDKVIGMLSQRDFVTYTFRDALNRIASTAKANIEDGNATPISIATAAAAYAVVLVAIVAVFGVS